MTGTVSYHAHSRLSSGSVTFSDPGEVISAVRWSSPRLSAERVWRVVCRAFALEVAGARRDCTKLLVNGQLIGDPAAWPTTESDAAGPAAWLGRQNLIAAGDDLLVYVRSLQEHDRVLFRAAVELLGPQLPHLGLPSGHVELEAFHGAYRNTPGGIHRESCTNIHLVLEGRKSMHFWQGTGWLPEGVEIRADSEPEAGDLEEYLPTLDPHGVMARGRSLTVARGGGFFWRSGIWHSGETHERSTALNIAAYTRTLDVEADNLALWAGRLLGEVPTAWLARYRAHISFTGGYTALLARLSALGMRPAQRTGSSGSRSASPQASSQTSSVAPRPVRRVSSAPVVWAPGSPGQLAVAALGQCVEFTDSGDLRSWLEEMVAAGGDTVVAVPAWARRPSRWLCEQEILEQVEEQ